MAKTLEVYKCEKCGNIVEVLQGGSCTPVCWRRTNEAAEGEHHRRRKGEARSGSREDRRRIPCHRRLSGASYDSGTLHTVHRARYTGRCPMP